MSKKDPHEIAMIIMVSITACFCLGFSACAIGLIVRYSSGDSKVRMIKKNPTEFISVGKYKMHIGPYEGVKDGQKEKISLSHDTVKIDDKKYEYEIDGDQLMVDGEPLMRVTDNDVFVDESSGVEYRYEKL